MEKLKKCSFCFGLRLSSKDHKELAKRAYKNYKYSCKKNYEFAKYWWYALYYKHTKAIKA